MTRTCFAVMSVVGGCAVAPLALAQGSEGSIAFFTDESAWQDAVGGGIRFSFTADNTSLADEVPAPPPPETDLETPELTFDAAMTGLPASFVFATIEPGATFVFDLFAPACDPCPNFDDALSIGDGGNGGGDQYENDDWEMTFYGSAVALSALISDRIKW